MFFKKPIASIVFFAGVLLFAIFIAYFLLPSIKSSRFVVAIVQTFATVLCLMTGLAGVIYFIMKRSFQPFTKLEGGIFQLPGTVTKMPAKEKASAIVAMPMTG